MSEYQYYEFRAVDRRLDEAEMRELRGLSTRAAITPTRFVNEYHWGDFKGNPRKLMERYFDAFVYYANWGTRWFMLRVPKGAIDVKAASVYCAGEGASLHEAGDFVRLEFLLDGEADDWADEWDGEEDNWMAALLPLRDEIQAGDLRSLYLGWLHCALSRELEDDDDEPPVPPGLGRLTAAQNELAAFLRLDDDLLAVAAECSGEKQADAPQAALRSWIASLPAMEKDALLLRFVEGESHLRWELLRRFRDLHGEAAPARPPARRRTVGELLQAAEARTEARERQEAERRAEKQAQREREEAQLHDRYLDKLAKQAEAAWRKVDELIATKQSRKYKEAVRLLGNLREALRRAGREAEFGAGMESLCERHSRKSALLERFREAGLGVGEPSAT